jgi:hypothetical protein
VSFLDLWLSVAAGSSTPTAPGGPVRATAPGPRRPDSAGMARAARQHPVEVMQLARHAPCEPRFGRRCWLSGERSRATAPCSGTGCGGYLMTILVRGPIAPPAITTLVSITEPRDADLDATMKQP